MNIVVTYDVSTETPEGRKRLRHVALECKNFGQRVQKSVFECTVNPMQYEVFIRRLLSIIEVEEDRLRIYRLTEPKEKHVEIYGLDGTIDFEGPLLV
ncbi:MAG: CRISPR-associated endonuclease Cas2 [Nitrospiria bacterium]